MLHEDQQVGWPVLQRIYMAKVCTLVICHLRETDREGDNVREYAERDKRQYEVGKKNWVRDNIKIQLRCGTILFTHIIQIILKILILSPDDAHGWVRALSP